jgi:hypothetical protein
MFRYFLPSICPNLLTPTPQTRRISVKFDIVVFLIKSADRVRTPCLFNTAHKFGELCIKAIPLQAWTGPEGSRSLILPDFKTIGT